MRFQRIIFALNLIYEKELKRVVYNIYERRGLLVLAPNCEKATAGNVPVRLISAIFEELNYKELYYAYHMYPRHDLGRQNSSHRYLP